MELTLEQALQQGVAAHKEGKLQDAERLYRAILQSQPLHPDANHNLGLIAVSVNKADAALPLFKIALEANPKIKQFWLSYVDALIKEQQFENAKQVFEQAKTQGMAGDKLYSLEAKLALIVQAPMSTLSKQKKSLTFSEKRKKLPEQKKIKKKAKKQNVNVISPPQEQLTSLLEHYQNGQFSDAEKLSVKITQDFPKHQYAWKVLGAVLGATGRKSEAVDANQTSVALSPQDAEVHNNLGVMLNELGRLDEAVASCSQAIALKSDYAEAHYNLGNTLQELGRLDEAEASYTRAIALKPGSVEAHSNLGITLEELGRLDEAEASYTRAIALKHDHASAHYGLSKVLYKMNNKDSALESLKRGNTIDPKSKDIQLLLSVLQAKKAREDTEGRVNNILPSDCLILPPSKILELNRSVEQELIAYLYSKELKDLDKEKDPSFGDTKGSKYDLFEDSHPAIQNLESGLKSILMKAFNLNIFIKDSFFSIFGAGGGTGRHNHVTKDDEDSTFSLAKQKYSLVYYLSVGDQGCTEPGFLKFYDPNEEILPSKGLIIIFPANRYHSSFYGGNKDRIIIGVNFYTL